MSDDYIEIHENEYEPPHNFDVVLIPSEQTVSIAFSYPMCDDKETKPVKYVEVNQGSVRASDGIRLEYDYERDGFSVQQPYKVFYKTDEPNHYDFNEVWEETAFVQSWALKEKSIKPDDCL